MEAGVDDVGLINLDRNALKSQREGILHVYPFTRSIISLVIAYNRENIQSPARYMANEEFHCIAEKTSHLARKILRKLNQIGLRGVVVNNGWPMDMDKYPGKIFDVSHKVIAIEAGLGHMGLNRLVLHPKYGSSIMLDSILIGSTMDEYDNPLQENPCIKCNLCAAVCPTGAITKDNPFDFMACLTHTYRDNYIGFNNLMEAVVISKDMEEYRSQFDDRETSFMWQSLMYGMSYRCCYCMAVCPAGEEIVTSYLENKKQHIEMIVKPLKDRQERVYVLAGSRAETEAARNENKEIKIVKGIVRALK
jgi:epoxyqueuosine reductase QueG